MTKSVLITGASRGIGYTACIGFLKAGWKVFACARDIHLLTDLSNENSSLYPVACDLKDRSYVSDDQTTSRSSGRCHQ